MVFPQGDFIRSEKVALRISKVFQHPSLKSKFTQKHFPNHDGIYIT